MIACAPRSASVCFAEAQMAAEVELANENPEFRQSLVEDAAAADEETAPASRGCTMSAVTQSASKWRASPSATGRRRCREAWATAPDWVGLETTVGG